ncbi:NUDIX domain-containing protein [Nocardioides sp.]|uniref:NUDIX domain-containing protein n=1 Tax=Nocardioides sp. TaxID=35761 RepID=UPI0037839AFF
MPPELADLPEEWPVSASRVAYDGGWVVRVREDQVRRPDHPEEEPFARLVVEHPGAVVVIAVDDEDRVLCLWQYRHVIGRRLVQLPAGLLDKAGEDRVEAARRELLEEAGLEAREWTHLTSTYSSPGFTSELSHYYLARGLTSVDRGDFRPQHEEAEMEAAWVPFAELHDAVVAGRLSDAHLAIAVLVARSRLAPAPRRSGADHRRSSQ